MQQKVLCKQNTEKYKVEKNVKTMQRKQNPEKYK